MSMAAPAALRRPTHLRRIVCEGFVRDDGLIDIEGLLVDTKPDALRLVTKEVPPGEPIHQMRVRLTIDRERRIVDARAFSEHTPYAACSEVEANYRRLIGLRIEPGFTRQVKRLLRGVEGCTHVTELLPPMASTYFQVVWGDSGVATDGDALSRQGTSPLGACHALRLDGDIVKTYFPQQMKKGAQ
jgi:hypothetical protein